VRRRPCRPYSRQHYSCVVAKGSLGGRKFDTASLTSGKISRAWETSPRCREILASGLRRQMQRFWAHGDDVCIYVDGHAIADRRLWVVTGEVPMLTEAIAIPHQRVMVAEDHPGMSAVIRRLLVAHDFDVVGNVEDGARVLDEAARLQPDIILLDLHMPNVNGIDACRELTRRLPRTRTIVVTAEDPAVVRAVALAAGAFAFVEKRELHTALLPAVNSACHQLAA
jgi:CheY-like chemotaxis protein